MMHVILDPSVPFNWNGTLLRFDAWPDNAYGVYDYTTRNRRHRIDYLLRPAVSYVEIILLKIDRTAPVPCLPGTRIAGNELILAPGQRVRPETVPQALLLLVIWAETVGFFRQGDHNHA
jgi:hypothetical protein